jgi:Vilmaviridae head maturation protease
MPANPTPEKKSAARLAAEEAKLLAEAAKLEAETEQIRAESRKAVTDAELAEVQLLDAKLDLRTTEARATEAEVQAKAAVLALAEREREVRRDEVTDERTHVLMFDSEVSQASVKAAMRRLTEWHRLDPDCDIEIVFTSPGGSVYFGMALFDYICKLRRDGHTITTGALGYAASMAGILLQAGDHRWIGRESYMLIHELSAGTGGKINDMKDDVKFYERVCARIVDIFISRAKGKISAAKFRAGWTRTDWWLTSDECLKFGFVDEVR